MPNVLVLFRKGDVRCCFSGKSLAYNTRTDSTPSCQGRGKSRYRNQPQKSQLLATHAMMMIAARIESVTKRTREIILRLFLTLKDCCLKDSTSSLWCLWWWWWTCSWCPMVALVFMFIDLIFFLTVHCQRQGHIEGNNRSYNIRAACGTIRPSMLALRFRVWKHIYTVAKVMNNSDINRWRVFINVFYISVIPLRYVSMPLGNTAWKPSGGQSSWQWCGINFLNLSFRISAKVINFASVAPFSPYCRNNLLEFGAEH